MLGSSPSAFLAVELIAAGAAAAVQYPQGRREGTEGQELQVGKQGRKGHSHRQYCETSEPMSANW